MGKKGKKSIKLNQRIKSYFDGDAFDVGVQRVSTLTLIELFSSLGIYDIEHEKNTLLRSIRMLWSQNDSDLRGDIVAFFVNDGKIYKRGESDGSAKDKLTRLEILFDELDLSSEEQQLLRAHFLASKGSKITRERILSRLDRIRFEQKLERIEQGAGGRFDDGYTLYFNATLPLELFGESFSKIYELSIDAQYADLRDASEDVAIAELIKQKDTATLKATIKLQNLAHSIADPHPHLSRDEILIAFKQEHERIDLPLLNDSTLRRVLKKVFGFRLERLYDGEVLLSVPLRVSLPHYDEAILYSIEFSISLDEILSGIYYSKDLSIDLEGIKSEELASFYEQLDSIVSECGEVAKVLRLSREELYKRLYESSLDLITPSLHIASKTRLKILRRFSYYVQEEVAKKQRYELLARTIRDFKEIFSEARSMRRKLTLHIGPTNSGKTHEAHRRLSEADTGYYLAPLRLLALEGYEKLSSLGLETALVTGEERLGSDEASHISSTIEMLNFDVEVDLCVIDEVQMIDDADRGWAWANAIIGVAAKEVIMTGSPNVRPLIEELALYLGEELEVVEFERKSPLVLMDRATPLDRITPATAVVAFSRKDVLYLKGKLSSRYAVSVLYGNLSPEVRRSEARRFRDGSTQVLVATDAIAMGMNLPIKTLLFYDSSKFDGKRRRELTPSEVQQIAGRAGRYGIKESGEVGAVDERALRSIGRSFTKKPKDLSLPIRVMANLDHIELISSILQERSLYNVLSFFDEHMVFSGPFEATNIEDMLEVARLVDEYELDIVSKYHLSCAPLSLGSPYVLEVFESYLLAMQEGRVVHYHQPRLKGSFAATSSELLLAEDMTKEISLYLWLSYRFESVFVDALRASEARAVINAYIEATLARDSLSSRCKLCEKILPKESEYGICSSCYKKKYQRNFRR